MTQFLTALISIFVGLGALFGNPSLPDVAKSNMEENLQGLEAPDADPAGNYEEALENKEEGQSENSENNNNDASEQASNNSNNEENGQTDTEKEEAYNTKGENEVGEVAGVAVEKAEPLVTCDDPEADCDESESESSESTPTPTPTEAEPEPTPTPVDPPIVIDPPVEPVPYPCGSSTYPKPPQPMEYKCLPVY